MNALPRLLTVPETEAFLRLSPQGFLNLRNAAKGPPEAYVGGRVLFREDHLLDWLDQRTTQATDDDSRPSRDPNGSTAVDELEAPNEATRVYRARIAARKDRADAERKRKGGVAALREQQRRAGSGGVELRPAAPPTELDAEATRARRAEQALKHGCDASPRSAR
jgi:hypothetical protein